MSESSRNAASAREERRSLKICVAIHGFALGGMEEHALDLAAGMVARGHHVTMILPFPHGGPLAPLIPRMIAAGVRVETRDLLELEGIRARTSAKWDLWKWMKRERFDVFHLHRYNPYHSHAFPFVAALAGVPMRLVTEHDPGLGFDSPPRMVAAFGDSFVTNWIVASSFSERAMAGNTRRDPTRVKRIHLGIPTSRFSAITPTARKTARASLDIPEDALAVGTVCRLVNLKGIDDLLGAAPGLLDRFPNLYFLVAGSGPESDRLAEAGRAISERIRFVGRVESTPDFFAALDVFAFPSRYEGFGLAVAEALTSGLPVVGSDVGAIKEMLESSGGGTVVPQSDPPALSNAIAAYLEDPSARATAGSAGREFAIRELSLEAMIARFEAAYRGDSGGEQ